VAKTSKIARDRQRREVVARYAARRAELKAIVTSPDSTAAEKADAQRELQRQPRDASATRLRNRGATTGRPRGVLSKQFGLDRVAFREKALNGELPGIRKASW
jgi:small subunit ribosomal protein S14